MAKTFRYKHLLSSTQNAAPTASKLLDGEIAVNNFAGEEKLFVKNSTGEVVSFISESQINAKIDALDKAADAVNGKVVTTVSEVNGLVSETKANVKDLQLGGYSNDGTASGTIGANDTVNTALAKLENKIGSNAITNEDKSIVVTAPTGTATTTDIKVNIKSGEKVLQLGNDGIFTDIKISGLTAAEIQALGDENVKEAYKLLDSTGGTLGDVIKIYKDSSLYSVYLGHVDDTLVSNTGTTVNPGSGDTALCFIYEKADGTYELVAVNVEDFLQESEFADGLQVVNHVVSVKIDANSEQDSQATPADFLSVSSDGIKVSGIKDEIDRKIAALDVTGDTEVAGQYVAAIEETNGMVAVKTRANVSEAVLNNYSKGSDATAVAAADTVNQAISKLENQVDKAKAAATTKVVKDNAASHLTIVSAQSTTDSSVTYTIGETDIASASALTELRTDATNSANTLNTAIQTEVTRAQSAETILQREIDEEISARTNADSALQSELDNTQSGAGLASGGAYVPNTSAKYISGATSLADADNKLDTTLYQLSGAVQSAVSGLDFTDTAVTNQWVTKVDESDGKVSPSRSYISVTNLTTDGTPDFEVSSTPNEIILSAGTF